MAMNCTIRYLLLVVVVALLMRQNEGMDAGCFQPCEIDEDCDSPCPKCLVAPTGNACVHGENADEVMAAEVNNEEKESRFPNPPKDSSDDELEELDYDNIKQNDDAYDLWQY